MKDILIVHHNDMDGYGAVAEVILSYKNKRPSESFLLEEFKYGGDTLPTLIGKYNYDELECIYVVDCSVSASDDIEFLNGIAEVKGSDFITLYDHHPESFAAKGSMKFNNVIDKSICGTMITHNQLNKNLTSRTIQNQVNCLDMFEFEKNPDMYFEADQMNAALNAYGMNWFIWAYMEADTFEDFYNNNKDDIDESNAKDEAVYNNVDNILYKDKRTVKLNPGMQFNVYVMNGSAPRINLNILRLKSGSYDETLFDQFATKDEFTDKFRIATRVNGNFPCAKYVKDYILAYPKLLGGGGHLYAFGCAIEGYTLDEYMAYLDGIKDQSWCLYAE